MSLLPEAKVERGRRSHWRDKLRWHSRSREPSESTSQREPDLGPVSLNINHAATTHNERMSTLLSGPQNSSNDIQARDTVNVIEDDADTAGSTDLWSVAYREAVSTFCEEVKSIILKGAKIEELFTSLDETKEELAGDSLFLRGVKRLQSPLRNFNLALDMASPLTSIEPTVAIAFGAVKSVTALAIGICGAEDSLNTQIVTMLEYLAIIDECDTLGQKLDTGNDIHKALVIVYKDLLKFYIAALDILTSKVFVLALVSNQLSQRLPTIVSEFVKHAAHLQSRIGNATLEVVADIKKLLQDNKIEKLLGINKDKQRSEFHCEIRGLKANDACKWVVADSQFVRWYDAPTSEHLVIFGAMGCGKTVTTAHVVDELIHLNSHELPRPLICYHYCKDDETGNVVYIYSSLILQLLDQQEGFKVEFDKWYENTKKSTRVDPAQSSSELGNFFSTCVEALDRPLFVVIDALDECHAESRTELATLLDGLSKKTPRLKVFFSSRPQEEIEDLLAGTAKIRLSPNRERDAIIVRHTVNRCLGELPLGIQSFVTDRLSEMAHGSAIWVKLTVDLIQKRKIKALGPMKLFLRDMPSSAALSQLYAKLIAQTTEDDPDNEHLVTTALEILAVAQRPLSILELGWAVALDGSPAETRTVEELRDYVDAKRVLSLVQPFIAQVDFQDLKKNQVRLVHQSLKELILREPLSIWAQSKNTHKSSEADKQSSLRRRSRLEAALLRLCVRYLLLDDFDQYDLFSEEQQRAQTFEGLIGSGFFDNTDYDGQQPDSSAEPQDLESKQEAEPIYFDPSERGFGEFFVYTSCFWIDHFKVAAPESLPDTSDIVRLSRAKSKRLRNWIGQNCRPDCTITPRFANDSDLQDPLTVVSRYGPEIALKKLLQDCDVGGNDFLINSVEETIQQILRYGDISRIRILFRDPRIGPKLRNLEFFCQSMVSWINSDRDSREWIGIFDLVDDIFDVLVREQCGNELLCRASGFGCLAIVERLFNQAARDPSMRTELLRDPQRGYFYHQSVGEAVWYDRVGLLRYLLEQDGIEAHLRHRNSRGYNVFHQAAVRCNPEILTLLISRFKEGVDQVDNDGYTPLRSVVLEAVSTPGRIESAKTLLTLGGADVRAGFTDEPSNWYEPLRSAARNGDVKMCRTLVEAGGADPRSVLNIGEDGRPSLIDHVEPAKKASNVLDTLCSLAGLSTPQDLPVTP